MYDVPKDCNFFTEFESNLWLMLQQTTKKLKNFPKNFQLKFQTQTEKTSLLFLLTKPGLTPKAMNFKINWFQNVKKSIIMAMK